MTIFEQLDSIFAGADPWPAALEAVVKHVKADSGTIHTMGSDGMLHLKAASAGIPPQVLAIRNSVLGAEHLLMDSLQFRRPHFGQISDSRRQVLLLHDLRDSFL